MTFIKEKSGSVALITIDRPEKKNALTLPAITELADLVRGVADDPDIKGLVLTGNGAFCSGADLRSIVAKGKEEPGSLQQTIEEIPQQLIRALLDLPFPTVAALDGPAIGMGMDIALACDCRLISDKGWMMQGWGRVGLIPGTGGELLLRRYNPAILWRVLHDQKKIDGRQAEAWGIGEVVESGAVEAAVSRLEKLATMPDAALSTYVSFSRSWLKEELDRHLTQCAQAQVALLSDPSFESRVETVVGGRR
ncbi:enoyl-CoA hydratase/isomerase family protein [Nocardia jiangxiensis]|uniref:enoyl-CoA hydratase/isomerase family protein n=1 Tax=Nocardia jiangxiensis TaxID=282685 RepID=UPI0002D6D5FC|nr:enoyl-CoA hydratase/isomerase family protein [Nocardia jiangxiensis]